MYIYKNLFYFVYIFIIKIDTYFSFVNASSAFTTSPLLLFCPMKSKILILNMKYKIKYKSYLI